MKIAVFADENGIVLPFFASGVVGLYSDDSGEWVCINQIPFEMGNQLGLNDTRIYIRKLVSEFEDCKMLVIDGIKGIARIILEEFKIGIWQFKGTFLFRLLDKIRDELFKLKEEKVKSIVSPVLIGNEADAVYGINLVAVLEENSSLSSKDVLIPFMKNTNFRKLIIDCTHTPKWFDSAMNQLKLNYMIEEKEENQLRVIVEPFDIESGINERQCVRLNNSVEAGGCSSGCCGSGIF
jgi:Fe-only nitrogenase accessory protein AnfO